MGGVVARALWHVRVGSAFAWWVPLYWLVVFPQARHELRGWRQRARKIPDPVLREHALRKLRSEAMTAEGAAAFGILATARTCRDVVRACVAFEVIYDYVDALAEEAVGDVRGNNRLLYGALVAAFAPGTPVAGWDAGHACRDDGDYLRALVETCRRALALLPAHECVRPKLVCLAQRAREAQSLHHASCEAAGEQALARWALAQQPPGHALRWWELGAASGSPLGFFALLAAAAHRRTTPAKVSAIERAYFPWIAALSWLLESLIDQEEDMVVGGPSYVAHYGSPQCAARRLALIAEHAAADARRLPQAGRHTLLLTGMVGMYLSDAGAEHETARAAAEAVRHAIGGPLIFLSWTLRARRRLLCR
jgi:tetraprenyl-beta-curcumene synthase